MADKKNDLKIRAEKAQKEITEVLNKYELSMTSNLEFPIYKELPDDVKLAINVLNKHQPTFVPIFTDLNKNE